MANCELVETCIFFNGHMANMPSTADVYKKMFCQRDLEKCARYTIVKAKGRGTVPADLYPNQMEKAISIIEKS
jgi:hypothetical protein